MKKMLFILVSMLTIAVSANAMSYERARNEALFLTDKMAYELNLTDAQYEAAYEINLDYLMGVSSRYDVFGTCWERRNIDLEFILYSWQWNLYRAATYFLRPLYWNAGYWHFRIYTHYPHRDYFYFGRPHFYASYRGGHSWRHNGGRSYYEGRHNHYRPNHSREQHVGMRTSWDRGDYRLTSHNSSSTRHSATVEGSRRTDNAKPATRELHVGSRGSISTSTNDTHHREVEGSRSNTSESRIHNATVTRNHSAENIIRSTGSRNSSVGSINREMGSRNNSVGSISHSAGSTRSMGSSTRSMGSSTRSMGSSTRSMGSSTRSMGSSTRSMGSSTRSAGSSSRSTSGGSRGSRR